VLPFKSKLGIIEEMKIKAHKNRQEGNHMAAVKAGLDVLNKTEAKFNINEIGEIFIELTAALYSASDKFLFLDFIKLYELYNKLTSFDLNKEPPNGYRNHALLILSNVKSNLFAYYEQLRSWQDLHTSVAQLELASTKVDSSQNMQEHFREIIFMARSALKGMDPYYVVSFRLPYALPVPDGEYDIQQNNAIKLTIETKPIANLTSLIGDRYFSKVDIKFKGFTTTNHFWGGPVVNENREPYNISKCIKIINNIILRAKLIDKQLSLVSLSHSSIGKIHIVQYYHDGQTFHQTISFTFGGDSLVEALSKQELSADNTLKLFKDFNDHPLSLHDELYSNALMHKDNSSHTNAFYMLNSAFEAMLIYYLKRFSEESSKSEEFDEFMKGKSRCDYCELFKNSGTLEPIIGSMAPSAFAQIKYFKKISNITNSQISTLNSLVNRLRNDSYRNNLVHGKITSIPENIIDDSFKSYLAIQELMSNLNHA